MTTPRTPATEAGRRLLGSVLLALAQEPTDVADLRWVDDIADVEAEVRDRVIAEIRAWAINSGTHHPDSWFVAELENMARREPQDANPDGVLNAAVAEPPALSAAHDKEGTA
jgi:hypothetical protein